MSGDLRDAYSNVPNIIWRGLILFIFCWCACPCCSYKGRACSSLAPSQAPQPSIHALYSLCQSLTLVIWSPFSRWDSFAVTEQSPAKLTPRWRFAFSTPRRLRNMGHCPEARTRPPFCRSCGQILSVAVLWKAGQPVPAAVGTWAWSHLLVTLSGTGVTLPGCSMGFLPASWDLTASPAELLKQQDVEA